MRAVPEARAVAVHRERRVAVGAQQPRQGVVAPVRETDVGDAASRGIESRVREELRVGAVAEAGLDVEVSRERRLARETVEVRRHLAPVYAQADGEALQRLGLYHYEILLARSAEGRGVRRRELRAERRELFGRRGDFVLAQLFTPEALAQYVARVSCVIGHRADVAAYRRTVPHSGEGVRHTAVVAVKHGREEGKRNDEHGARGRDASRVQRTEQMRGAHSVRQHVICEEERNVGEVERVARRQQREDGVGNVADLPGKSEIMEGEEVGIKSEMKQVRDDKRGKGEVEDDRAGEARAARKQRKRGRECGAERGRERVGERRARQLAPHLAFEAEKFQENHEGPEDEENQLAAVAARRAIACYGISQIVH